MPSPLLVLLKPSHFPALAPVHTDNTHTHRSARGTDRLSTSPGHSHDRLSFAPTPSVPPASNKMSMVKAVPQEQVAALQQQGEYQIKSSDAQPALGECKNTNERPVKLKRNLF